MVPNATGYTVGNSDSSLVSIVPTLRVRYREKSYHRTVGHEISLVFAYSPPPKRKKTPPLFGRMAPRKAENCQMPSGKRCFWYDTPMGW